jgi:hypothetical protein
MQLLPAGLHVLFCGGTWNRLVPLTSVGFEAEAGMASTNVSSKVINKTHVRFFITHSFHNFVWFGCLLDIDQK